MRWKLEGLSDPDKYKKIVTEGDRTCYIASQPQRVSMLCSYPSESYRRCPQIGVLISIQL